MSGRLVAPVVALLAAALVVTAALLPEYVLEPGGGGGVASLDPGRPVWIGVLGLLLLQVGLILAPTVMLLMRESEGVAAGILIGAGLLGVAVRLVRIAQLGESPTLAPGLGSWLDALADASVLAAGVLALSNLRGEQEVAEALEGEPDAALAPPPGEPV